MVILQIKVEDYEMVAQGQNVKDTLYELQRMMAIDNKIGTKVPDKILSYLKNEGFEI